MEFKLSEYGNHTLFKSLNEGVKYCRENNLTDGEHGRLWIIGKNKKEADAWRELNERKLKDYMILSYNRGKKTFIWDEDWSWCESEKYWAACQIMADRFSEFLESLTPKNQKFVDFTKK